MYAMFDGTCDIDTDDEVAAALRYEEDYLFPRDQGTEWLKRG